MTMRAWILGAVAAVGLMACGGGNLLKDAEAKAKAACECKDAECVRPHVKWFNEQSLKDGGAALKGLSAEEAAQYSKFAVQAGECQAKIKMGGK